MPRTTSGSSPGTGRFRPVGRRVKLGELLARSTDYEEYRARPVPLRPTLRATGWAGVGASAAAGFLYGFHADVFAGAVNLGQQPPSFFLALGAQAQQVTVLAVAIAPVLAVLNVLVACALIGLLVAPALRAWLHFVVTGL